MTDATYTEATALRERLEALGTARGDHIEAGHKLEVRIGEALREVRDMPRVTMGDAAALLGMSRQAAYRILEDARRRA